MNKKHLRHLLFMAVLGMVQMTSAQAHVPVWTFDTVPAFPPSISLTALQNATVQYKITNHDVESHTLRMRPITGIAPSGCTATLGYMESCSLSLSVTGSALKASVNGGPQMCDQGNPLQCYQPTEGKRLAIHLVPPFIVTPSGDGREVISPNTPQPAYQGETETFTVTAKPGHTLSTAVTGTCPLGSWSGSNYTTGPITGSCSVKFSASVNSYVVTPSGDGNELINPGIPQNVNYGTTTSFVVAPNPGYSVSPIVDGTCPQGSWSGITYTTGVIVGACTVVFNSVGVYPTAKGPSNVRAVQSSSQGATGSVTVSWTPPTNTGTGTISGYTVTYGVTGSNVYTTAGCTITGSSPATSCIISGLTMGTAYTFTVTTSTTLLGTHPLHGPATFSNSVTPVAGLAVSPSILALAGGGGGASRTVTLTNYSTSAITILQTPAAADFTPGITLTLTSATCTTNTVLSANGGSCTLTFAPGGGVSPGTNPLPCTSQAAGEVILSSYIMLTNPANTTPIQIALLGKGCLYQGGYVFTIDDTVTGGSIGGSVVAQVNHSNGTFWSHGGVFDPIWGIDYTSTPSSPSPNETSSPPAQLWPGQLNCDGSNDGVCATNNLLVYFGNVPNYAAGFCQQPLASYNDWYLPSICQFTVNFTTCSPGTDTIDGVTFQAALGISGNLYWSTTEDPFFPDVAYYYIPSPPGQGSPGGDAVYSNKDTVRYVRCIRNLTD